MRSHPAALSLALGCAFAVALAVGPARALAADPFAPPGTELVRVEILHHGMADELYGLGIQPEEAGPGYLIFRVTPEELALLRAHAFPVTVVTEEEAYGSPTPGATGGGGGSPLLFTSYAQLTTDLQALATNYPSLCRLTSCGTSVQGRSIWALKVTRHPDIAEAEPKVRLIGCHHGNERMSVEMVKDMAHYLLENYGLDPTVTTLVNTREIWLVPMMNPDGEEAGSRYNAHGVDLNRNYGYMWESGSQHGSSYFSEPETQAIHNLSTDHWFDLGLSFHTNAQKVNSVWNYSPHYTEDDPLIWTLTNVYATYSGYQPVRGWYWYETHGDCNDWSYGARGTYDWTIEVEDSNESLVWSKNKPGMLYMMGAAGWGIGGTVTDAVTGAPLRARVTVEGDRWPAFTDSTLGDYRKPLPAGTYTLHVSANGHQDAVIAGLTVPASGGITQNVALVPGGGRYIDRVEVANQADPNNAYANYTLTMSMLGAPDGVGCSIGKSGNVVLDFGPGSEARDLPGADLCVYESNEDAPGEGFTLYGGNSYLGPWTLIGAGHGTTSFDLAGTGLSVVRYVRIVDDGDGNANDPYAGFDVDAVESFGTYATSVAGLNGSAPGGSRGVYLAPPSPNPATSRGSQIALGFETRGISSARLEVFDAQGRLVTRIVDGALPGEWHRTSWPATDAAGRPVAPGIYLVRLSAGGEATSRKLVILP